MKCLIVKVKDRKRTPTYKKMISGKDVYSFPSNLDDAIEYSSSTLHEENEWYMITSFSKTTFCIELLKEDFSSVVSFQAKCKKVRYYRYFPLGRVTLN